MSDTNSIEKELVCSLQLDTNVASLLGRIANYYYIYGEKRSWFMADWRQDLGNAIELDSITVGTTKYPRSRPLVEKILANASEYSAYGISKKNKNKVVNTICEMGQAALERFNRKQFKLKLAGKELEVWNW